MKHKLVSTVTIIDCSIIKTALSAIELNAIWRHDLTVGEAVNTLRPEKRAA
ncbi:MAG: hypothetical protein QF415_17320 [Candidatus Undinarchaeales archaeon]|jgi:hypothetical protein|nr:hypothetical protein [Candidatus Undinarchaeales archaeon]MDP7491382.1 hypothetical protein [Candidatus Undinarchaeales archaeon]